MTSSSLLVDEEQARQFCRDHLVPFGGARLLQCCARKKYSNGLMKTPQVIVERTVLGFDGGRESEDKFIRELKKIEILATAGLYTTPSTRSKANEQVLRPEWMVPYITAFCLDEDDAADAFVMKVMETRKVQRKILEKQKPTANAPGMTSIISKMKSLLHQHPNKQYRWLKLDVDTKDVELIENLQKSMQGAKIIFAAESRGGYHVLLEKGPWCQGLYQFVAEVNRDVPKEDQWITIENNTGPMLAIPGTAQGGFVVKCATETWRNGVNLDVR